MLTNITLTRCFRSGLMMMVNDLEVNNVNFPSLTVGKQASEVAAGVLKKEWFQYIKNLSEC